MYKDLQRLPVKKWPFALFHLPAHGNESFSGFVINIIAISLFSAIFYEICSFKNMFCKQPFL